MKNHSVSVDRHWAVYPPPNAFQMAKKKPTNNAENNSNKGRSKSKPPVEPPKKGKKKEDHSRRTKDKCKTKKAKSKNNSEIKPKSRHEKSIVEEESPCDAAPSHLSQPQSARQDAPKSAPIVDNTATIMMFNQPLIGPVPSATSAAIVNPTPTLVRPADDTPISAVVAQSHKKYTVLSELSRTVHTTTSKVCREGETDVFIMKRERAINHGSDTALVVREWNVPVHIHEFWKGNPMSHGFALAVDLSPPGDNKYVVLPMLGPSFEQLRESLPTKRFSADDACRLALHSLHLVMSLHEGNIFHTHIEPSHFCIGSKYLRNTVFMISFAASRKMGKNGEKYYKWDASRSDYAPRLKSIIQDNGMKDMESWFYVALFLFVPHRLPWLFSPGLRPATPAEMDSVKTKLIEKDIQDWSDLPNELKTIGGMFKSGLVNYYEIEKQLLQLCGAKAYGACEWERPSKEQQAHLDSISPRPKERDELVKEIASCVKQQMKGYVPPAPEAEEKEEEEEKGGGKEKGRATKFE